MAKCEDEENDTKYDNIQYIADVMKGPAGIGFGMLVAEDQKKGIITIKVKKLIFKVDFIYLFYF